MSRAATKVKVDLEVVPVLVIAAFTVMSPLSVPAPLVVTVIEEVFKLVDSVLALILELAPLGV